VLSYLRAFGPATMPDIAKFGTIIRPPVQEAIASLGDALVRYEGPDGATLYDVTDGLLPAEDKRVLPRQPAVLHQPPIDFSSQVDTHLCVIIFVQNLFHSEIISQRKVGYLKRRESNGRKDPHRG
jgi:hypothetical protein